MLASVGSTRRTAMMPATEPTSMGGAPRNRWRTLLGDQDLVDGYGPSSRDLIPGHDLGAITLADAIDQGPPLGKLLGRGRGHCLAHADSILAIQPGPQQLRTISEALWWFQRSQPTRKGVLRILVQIRIATTIFRSHLSKNHNRNHHCRPEVVGLLQDGLHRRPAARLRPGGT